MALLELQCMLGVKCKDSVMIAADQNSTQSILIMRDDVDKLFEVDNFLLGVNGEPGDALQFSQFIARNLQLYRLRNKYQLDAPAVAHFVRNNLLGGLQRTLDETNTSFTMSVMLGGYDEKTGGKLYLFDFLGTCLELPFATHGFGGIIAASILDRYYRPGLTEPDAYELLKLCIREIQKRLLLNLPSFKVKTVSRYGMTTLPKIDSAVLQNTAVPVTLL